MFVREKQNTENQSDYDFFEGYLRSSNFIKGPKEHWKDIREKRPILFAFVQQYMGIPCTSIFPEQVFSTLDLVLTPIRSRMGWDLIEALIWWKRTHEKI